MLNVAPPKTRPKPGPWPPPPGSDPLPPPSWAKKTGFRFRDSGEVGVASGDSGQVAPPNRPPQSDSDLEFGDVKRPDPVPPPSPPPPPLAPPPRAVAIEIKTAAEKNRIVNGENKQKPVTRRRDSDGGGSGRRGSGQNGVALGADGESRRGRNEEVIDVMPSFEVNGTSESVQQNSHMKYDLRDPPGVGAIGFFGIQHYLSMFGSLILLPLIIVPAMGGSKKDTANVVSTVLFISGVTTLLHTSFGSRLPLIQGSSFVFLAPALAIINSPEFQGQNGNNFKHMMKKLQGAIILSSTFQTILGYSGLASLLLKLVNPVVVAPTMAAVGLSFYSYGFPLVSTCIEIGAVQIILVVIFSLYLRKITIVGHRTFLIYAVPLGLGITWAIALLLTETGFYSYKGCDPNSPSSDHCRKVVNRVKHCRFDASNAIGSSPWFRVPYPLQWGIPVFDLKTALLMCVVSIIAVVDSIGSYHASSLLVATKPPTPGVVSRGIGLEGLCSVLAGVWGTGTGSTTLTENVHTIAVTKIGSRRAIEVGAVIVILLSMFGKVGGFIASIPPAMVAGLLCIMWTMIAALGLSNLRYSEAGSSRNIIIVGLSLFLSLSIPAYFQQYGVVPSSLAAVPSFFQPYIVASHGPIRTKNSEANYFLNTLLSLHMVVAFVVAVVLDNTVPGSRRERGVYVWTATEEARGEAAIRKDYQLAFRAGRAFKWVKWVGF